MSAAIDLFGAVYTTQGGTRYHADRQCTALANGREFHATHADWDDAAGLYEVRRRSTISAAQFSYTACLVCVPAADALPPLPFVTGETFGHEPVTEMTYYGDEQVCARCHKPWLPMLSQPWPCTSAVVLGLVSRPACPDCGRPADAPNGRKCRSCDYDDQIDAWGTAL